MAQREEHKAKRLRARLPRVGRARTEVLPLDIQPQPDDTTCGPTCLHAVYRYWGDPVSLDAVVESSRQLARHSGRRGTLAVMLGTDALLRGYRATLHTFNLNMFDPSWFPHHRPAERADLLWKLRAQADARPDADDDFRAATESYLRFLRLGGRVTMRDLTSRVIAGYIREGKPILVGLSATYLYRCAREFGPNDDYDDIRGTPSGHFVVLHGYNTRSRVVTIADPLDDNPGFVSRAYTVSMARLVPAIMLGVLTYDGNLLVIEPAQEGTPAAGRSPDGVQ